MESNFFDEPSDLKEGMILKKGDALFLFNTFLLVENGYLSCFEGHGKTNFSIFETFNIKKPFSFCEKIYGYVPKDNYHDFPETRNGDFETLTRLVRTFIQLSEGKEIFYSKKGVSLTSRWKDLSFDNFNEVKNVPG